MSRIARFVPSVLWIIFFAMVVVLLVAPKPWSVHPKPESLEALAVPWLWWAGVSNLIALALVALTAPRWLRPLPEDFSVQPRRPVPRWWIAVVAGAMVFLAVLAGGRLNDSLWHDEEFNVRHTTVGTFRVTDDGRVKFRQTPWAKTLWYYDRGKNHNLQTILSRITHSGWRTMSSPGGLALSETALRLPSYVAGILAVGVVALLLARAGLPWVGALAAWLLAVHPWMIRMAAEARGYALVVLLLPLACLCALRAMESGRWRWWILLGVCELALVYTWLLAVFPVAVLNLCVALRLTASRPGRSVVLGRWLICTVLAAMVFWQLFAPCVPQFVEFLKHSHDLEYYDAWPRNILSQIFVGSYWIKSGSANSPYLEFVRVATAHPLATRIAMGLAIVLLAIGGIRLWRARPHGRWLVVVFVAPGILMLVTAILAKEYLFERYFAYVLPGYLALVAAGVWSVGEGLGRFVPTRFAPALVAVLAVAGFCWLTVDGRSVLLARPPEGFRESVLLTRETLDPNAPDAAEIITAATLLPPTVYDPRVRKAPTKADYIRLMQEADQRGVPLYANNGFPKILAFNHPEVYGLLTDPTYFEVVGEIPGYDTDKDRVVHRYRSGSVQRLAPVANPNSD